MDRRANAAVDHQRLFLTGGICILLVPLFYCVEALTFSGIPPNAKAWLDLFIWSRALGLFYLNALDIVSISLCLPFFCALYRVFAGRSPALAAVGGWVGASGVTVFLASRWDMTLGLLQLSDLYRSAAEGPARDNLVAAAQGASAAGVATPLSSGFALVAVAVILFAVAMLRAGSPWRIAGVAGIAAGCATVLANVAVALLPAASMPMMALSGIALFAYWVSAGIGLLTMARRKEKESG